MGCGPIVGLRCAQERRTSPGHRSVQGKPAARQGRKARDVLPSGWHTARLPDRRPIAPARGDIQVKANLARFTRAVVLLASMALTLGAGIKWDMW